MRLGAPLEGNWIWWWQAKMRCQWTGRPDFKPENLSLASRCPVVALSTSPGVSPFSWGGAWSLEFPRLTYPQSPPPQKSLIWGPAGFYFTNEAHFKKQMPSPGRKDIISNLKIEHIWLTERLAMLTFFFLALYVCIGDNFVVNAYQFFGWLQIWIRSSAVQVEWVSAPFSSSLWQG